MSDSMWYEVEIPEGCVDAGCIIIQQYLDPEGEERFFYTTRGDLTILGSTALLEASKFRMLSEAERSWIEDEEEDDR